MVIGILESKRAECILVIPSLILLYALGYVASVNDKGALIKVHSSAKVTEITGYMKDSLIYVHVGVCSLCDIAAYRKRVSVKPYKPGISSTSPVRFTS